MVGSEAEQIATLATHMYTYLVKHDFRECAPYRRGGMEGLPLGSLFEWWDMHWRVRNAKTKGPIDPEAACIYAEYREKQEEEQNRRRTVVRRPE